MSNFGRVFKRVLSSYKLEEKVLSVIVLIVLVAAVVQGLVATFSDTNLFVNAKSFYTEGFLADNPAVINPVFADYSDVNRSLSELVFSGLVKYDPNTATFVDDLATLTLSDDKKTYHFVLKDGVKWQDGQPLTADDVFYTFHDVIQSADFVNPVLKPDFEGVKIKEIDQKTIDFQLDSPNSYFVTNLSVGILPKHALQSVAVADLGYSQFNLKPIGSGPYKIDGGVETTADGNQKISLKTWTDYYGQKPKIENIHVNVYMDPGSLVKERTSLDIIAKISKDFYTQLQSTGKFNFVQYELPQYTAVFMNMDSVFLSKDKVRLALQKSVDKAALLKLLTDKVQVDTPLLDLKQSDWIYKPNLDEANGALFDAGYKYDPNSKDKVRKSKKGNPLKLVLLTRQYDQGSSMDQEITTVSNFLKTSWANIGVAVDVQAVDSDTFQDRLTKRDYDMVLTGQSLGYNFDTFSFWHSSQASGTGLNLSNYKSFPADALIEKIRGTFDQDKKTQLLAELGKTLSADIPAIFLYRPVYQLATDGKVQGINMNGMAYPSDRFAHIADWCIMCQK